MSLSSVSVSRPITILMFYIGVVLLGILAFANLSVDFLPPIKIPKLTVQTSYPNTSPEEVEQSVTQPIELALGTVVGEKKVSSVSREGHSVVTAEFYWGTNMDFALLEVREKLDQMREALRREDSGTKIFRRLTGITIAAFISEVRLEEVKKLLRRTDTRCFEIASQFTFGREDVLSRWFKGRTGMTMQEFRHKNGQPKSSGGGAKPKRK